MITMKNSRNSIILSPYINIPSKPSSFDHSISIQQYGDNPNPRRDEYNISSNIHPRHYDHCRQRKDTFVAMNDAPTSKRKSQHQHFSTVLSSSSCKNKNERNALSKQSQSRHLSINTNHNTNIIYIQKKKNIFHQSLDYYNNLQSTTTSFSSRTCNKQQRTKLKRRKQRKIVVKSPQQSRVCPILHNNENEAQLLEVDSSFGTNYQTEQKRIMQSYNDAKYINHNIKDHHDSRLETINTTIQSSSSSDSSILRLAKFFHTMNNRNKMKHDFTEACDKYHVPINGNYNYNNNKNKKYTQQQTIRNNIQSSSIQPSIEMQHKLHTYFRQMIGTGIWHDEVTSPLATCLNAKLIFDFDERKQCGYTSSLTRLSFCIQGTTNSSSNQGDCEQFTKLIPLHPRTAMSTRLTNKKDSYTITINECDITILRHISNKYIIDVATIYPPYTFTTLIPTTYSTTTATIIQQNDNNTIGAMVQYFPKYFPFDNHLHNIIRPIQNAHRIRLRYRIVVQLLLSSLYRGNTIRKKNILRQKATFTIQKAWKHHFAEVQKSVICIQKFINIKILYQRQEEAALCIQRFISIQLPKYQQTKIMNILRKRVQKSAASRMIQRRWRRYCHVMSCKMLLHESLHYYWNTTMNATKICNFVRIILAKLNLSNKIKLSIVKDDERQRNEMIFITQSIEDFLRKGTQWMNTIPLKKYMRRKQTLSKLLSFMMEPMQHSNGLSQICKVETERYITCKTVKQIQQRKTHFFTIPKTFPSTAAHTISSVNLKEDESDEDYNMKQTWCIDWLLPCSQRRRRNKVSRNKKCESLLYSQFALTGALLGRNNYRRSNPPRLYCKSCHSTFTTYKNMIHHGHDQSHHLEVYKYPSQFNLLLDEEYCKILIQHTSRLASIHAIIEMKKGDGKRTILRISKELKLYWNHEMMSTSTYCYESVDVPLTKFIEESFIGFDDEIDISIIRCILNSIFYSDDSIIWQYIIQSLRGENNSSMRSCRKKKCLKDENRRLLRQLARRVYVIVFRLNEVTKRMSIESKMCPIRPFVVETAGYLEKMNIKVMNILDLDGLRNG